LGAGRIAQYKEYELNPNNLEQAMELAFNADMIFVLNNSDAYTYMSQGNTHIPSSVHSDLIFPPKSYSILNPHGGFQYAALLDAPAESESVWIIFCYGYADEYAANKKSIWDFEFSLPQWAIELDAEYIQYFEFGSPPVMTWTHGFDFTIDEQGFSVYSGTDGTYVPGEGWRSTAAGFLRIGRDFADREVTNFYVEYTAALQGGNENSAETSGDPNGGKLFLSGVLEYTLPDLGHFFDANGTWNADSGVISEIADRIRVGLTSVSPLPLIMTINYIELSGIGTDPFTDPDWTQELDFTTNNYGFFGLGSYVPGVGWQSVEDGGAVALGIISSLGDTFIFTLQAFINDLQLTTPEDRTIDLLSRVTGLTDEDLFISGIQPNGETFYSRAFDPFNAFSLLIGGSFGGALADGIYTIVSAYYEGMGVNPFPTTWEHTIDFTASDGGFTLDGLGSYVMGVGWQSAWDGVSLSSLGIAATFAETQFTYMSITFEVAMATPDVTTINVEGFVNDPDFASILSNTNNPNGTNELSGVGLNAFAQFTGCIITFDDLTGTDGTVTITGLYFEGFGVNPF
jgi:hypothetical protein